MKTAPLAKLVGFASISVAQARRERGELYGRVAFFAIILGVFSSLWRAVAEAGMPVAADPKALVWYLAATEWIYLSAPPIHLEIQEAIRRGDVVYQIGRPVSYVMSQFASGMGLLAMRAPLLAVTAFLCALAFTGSTPPLRALVIVVPFGLAASALMTALYVGIGLLAFWLQDVTPVHWVWQKLIFILGGLMLPLELFPRIIQRAAAMTPFPSMLTGPASFVLGDSHSGISVITPAALAGHLAIWSCATALAVSWMFRRATSALTINGG